MLGYCQKWFQLDLCCGEGIQHALKVQVDYRVRAPACTSCAYTCTQKPLDLDNGKALFAQITTCIWCLHKHARGAAHEGSIHCHDRGDASGSPVGCHTTKHTGEGFGHQCQQRLHLHHVQAES